MAVYCNLTQLQILYLDKLRPFYAPPHAILERGDERGFMALCTVPAFRAFIRLLMDKADLILTLSRIAMRPWLP